MNAKRCPVCAEVKPLDEFPPRKDRASGRMSRCRPCDAARSREYYARNRDRVLARQRARGRRRDRSA